MDDGYPARHAAGWAYIFSQFDPDPESEARARAGLSLEEMRDARLRAEARAYLWGDDTSEEMLRGSDG